MVMMTHLGPLLVPSLRLPWPGHDAVIVFFVLSGYMIARAAERSDATLRDYTISRLSRLWSVVVPAAILCLVIVAMSGSADQDGLPPALLALWNTDANPDWTDLLYRSGANVFFLAQTWHTDLSMPLDNPFWSLNFEVAYYAIFGAAFYLGGIGRLLLVTALCVIAGPKVLYLMPCWLMGVGLYRCGWRLTQFWAVTIFVASTIIYVALFRLSPKLLLGGAADALWPLASTQHPVLMSYLADYVTAMLVTLNFLAAAHVVCARPIPQRVSDAISGAAGYTLSIYLYHVPLGLMVWLLLGMHGILGLTVVGLLIVALGHVTELKRGLLRHAMTGHAREPSTLIGPGGKLVM